MPRSLCIGARGKRHELSVNSSAHTLTEKSQNDILLWNSYSFISSERRQTMLKLQRIVKDYQAGDATVHALRGVSLQFRESEFVAILGHSGCGKTTLLNIIGVSTTIRAAISSSTASRRRTFPTPTGTATATTPSALSSRAITSFRTRRY